MPRYIILLILIFWLLAGRSRASEFSVVATEGCAVPQPLRPLPKAVVRPVGASLSLQSVASTDGVLYSWYKDGRLLEGEGEPMFTIMRLRRSDAGVYDLVMNNECGAYVQRCTVSLRTEGILVATESHIAIPTTTVGEQRDTLLREAFRNEGTAPVTIASARVFGGGGDVALVSAVGPSVVQPGEAIDIRLRFQPTSAGVANAVIDLNTASDIDPSIWVTTVAVHDDLPQGIELHGPVQFGKVDGYEVRDTSIVGVIRNSGSQAVSITDVRIVGPHAYHFGLVDHATLPMTLQPEQSFDAVLRFVPFQRGSYGAHLQCRVDGREVIVPLLGSSGEGGDAHVVNFGDVLPGEERDTLLVFHHIYDMRLRVDSVEDVEGAFDVVEASPALPAELHGWEYLKVRVRFRPTEPGAHASPLRVHWQVPETKEPISAARRVLRGSQRDQGTHIDDEAQSIIDVVPLPMAGDVTLRGRNGWDVARVVVYNAQGVQVLDVVDAGTSTVRMSADGLPSGIYRIVILYRNGQSRSFSAPVVR